MTEKLLLTFQFVDIINISESDPNRNFCSYRHPFFHPAKKW